MGPPGNVFETLPATLIVFKMIDSVPAWQPAAILAAGAEVSERGSLRTTDARERGGFTHHPHVARDKLGGVGERVVEPPQTGDQGVRVCASVPAVI